jgi:hypothetical protein
MLVPTKAQNLCDAQGRPYFLWDVDLTLQALHERMAHGTDDERAYWLAKVMRQAKPDDALFLFSEPLMRQLFPLIERHLGNKKHFWRWLLTERQRVSFKPNSD